MPITGAGAYRYSCMELPAVHPRQCRRVTRRQCAGAGRLARGCWVARPPQRCAVPRQTGTQSYCTYDRFWYNEVDMSWIKTVPFSPYEFIFHKSSPSSCHWTLNGFFARCIMDFCHTYVSNWKRCFTFILYTKYSFPSLKQCASIQIDTVLKMVKSNYLFIWNNIAHSLEISWTSDVCDL